MDTIISDVNPTDLLAARCLVIETIGRGELKWRHHGAGMIQAYLTPRLRIHIWHPSLQLPGMEHSGAIHDHRFDLSSTVLLGSLVNREFRFKRPEHDCAFEGLYTCVGPNYDIYTVECATSGKTENPAKVSDTARPIFYKDIEIPEGQRYYFPKLAFHQSMPVDEFVVTLVHKLNQEDFLARLLVPEGTTPVHAFKECNGTYPAHHTVVPTDEVPEVREFANCHLTTEKMRELASEVILPLVEKL